MTPLPPERLDVTPGLLKDVVDGLPFAVRRSDARELAAMDDEAVSQLVQAFVADDPVDISRAPAPTFVGLPAKEGHGTSREGVALLADDPPPRRADPRALGRRPVVAVLDTPVAAHPWLGDGEGHDGFWRDARNEPDGWGPVSGDPPQPLSLPVASGDGTLSHAGHGTFIAGIVRQLAPEARVISVPVMHDDGVAEERPVQLALEWLRDRARTAVHEGRPELFVDVVNLSFGYYKRGPRNELPTDALSAVLDELARLGVRVVASAGNRARTNPVIPAAFASADGPERTSLVSVGALDPDGEPAAYTNHGPWVSVYAPGTAVVSTLPRFAPVIWPPKGGSPDELGADPNFQASGFGRWGGTSFAAAWVSSSIAAHLLDQTVTDDLCDLSAVAGHRRAAAALEATKDDLAQWRRGRGAAG